MTLEQEHKGWMSYEDLEVQSPALSLSHGVTISRSPDFGVLIWNMGQVLSY
jgi:hypothetical protein